MKVLLKLTLVLSVLVATAAILGSASSKKSRLASYLGLENATVIADRGGNGGP